MRIPGRTKVSPIGIDIGARSFGAVQLQQSGGTWRIASAVYEHGLLGPELSEDDVCLFSQILERRGFQGSAIVLAVPGEMLKSDLLELPPAGPDVPMNQLARMELARTYKCRPDSFELSSWTLPASSRGGHGQQVMATACMHQDSESILKAWDLAGMEVVGLEAEAEAVARVCRPLLHEHDNISTALNITWGASSLVVMHRDVVIYERILSDSGIGVLHEILMKRLGVESDVAKFAIFEVGFTDELKDEWANWPLLTDVRGIMATHFTSMLDELQVSFSYAQHRYPEVPVDLLFLHGPGATIPNLCEPISSMLNVESRILTPGDIHASSPALKKDADDPGLTVATGLALFDG